MAFGLFGTGLNKKKLADIFSEVILDFQEEIGATVDSSPESVIGQIVGIFAEREALLWDLAEKVYLSSFLNSAESVQLDNVASIVGLTRGSATSSTAFLMLFGDTATVVPEGTLFEQDATGERFELDNGGVDSTIDLSNAAGVIISINTVADSTLYQVDLDDGTLESYDHTTGTGETATNILEKIAEDIQFKSPGLYRTVVDNEQLLIQRTDSAEGLQTTFTTTPITANITIDSYGTEGNVKAVNTGVIAVPAHTISSVITAVSGLDSVDNAILGLSGVETESDIDFRARIRTSTQISGAATVPAIQARLVDDLAFITAAIVLENRTDVIDSNGLPPHSFESVLSTTDSSSTAKDLIASKIFEVRPAGIQTFGNETGSHTDSQGNPQIMSFSFTEPVYIFLRIKYTIYSEESFPLDGEARIKTAVAEAGNDMAGSGIDVLRQRLFASIFTIPGVKTVDVMDTAARLSVAGGPSGVGQPSDIALVESGNTDGFTANKLIDSGASFTANVERMMWAQNTSGVEFALVYGPTTTPTSNPVTSDTDLDLENNAFPVFPLPYEIGDWGIAQDLPISARQIAVFNIDRIQVSETP